MPSTKGREEIMVEEMVNKRLEILQTENGGKENSGTEDYEKEYKIKMENE